MPVAVAVTLKSSDSVKGEVTDTETVREWWGVLVLFTVQVVVVVEVQVLGFGLRAVAIRNGDVIRRPGLNCDAVKKLEEIL